ncbi:MAG: TetR/AcrR family transcriptional regulator [Oceanospirillaceae bacterium]
MSPKIFSPEEKDARELEMLNCAKEIICTEGEAALTIDKLVKKLPYSKGTVYNHFTSKEDIILALCNAHMASISQVFNRALTFEGSSREKALAVHVGSLLNAQANPQDFMIGITVKTAGCTFKASELRQQQHQQIETSLLSPIFAHFRTAVDSGECTLPEGMMIEQLAFACWSVDFGTQLLLMGDMNSCSLRSQLNVERELINSINLILDGMCWQPLAKDFDWKASIARMKTEIFAAEVAKIATLKITS